MTRLWKGFLKKWPLDKVTEMTIQIKLLNHMLKLPIDDVRKLIQMSELNNRLTVRNSDKTISQNIFAN
jgi:hypothetical protein